MSRCAGRRLKGGHTLRDALFAVTAKHRKKLKKLESFSAAKKQHAMPRHTLQIPEGQKDDLVSMETSLPIESNLTIVSALDTLTANKKARKKRLVKDSCSVVTEENGNTITGTTRCIFFQN